MNDSIIKLADKDSCTGCGACVDVCSKSCITMYRDGLHAYPIINTELCVGCKKCINTCPSINPLEKKDAKEQKYYACWHKDKTTVRTSTSGGAGSALTEHAIDCGYYVAGVVLTKDGKVKHTIVKNKEEMLAFKGSKYVQSDSIGIYKDCVNAIKEGRKILYIGTPCQTEAMKRVLPKKLQNNLLTCSIICHGVNSPFVWSDYRNSLEKNSNSRLESYNFRCKSHGWQKKNGGPNLRISYEFTSGKKVDVQSWSNQFHFWFGQHYIMRPSCFNCHYRTEERHSDIIIGDFWNIEKVCENLDTFNGVSAVITTTSRGETFLHSNPYLTIIPVNAQKSVSVLKGLINRKTKETQKKEIERAKFFEVEYCQHGFDYMAKKYPYPTYLEQIINKLKSMV